jgi:hypothetical protein
MTVQVATCSAAQLFSGCLLTDPSPASDAIVDSDGEKRAGGLTILECLRSYCWQDKQLAGLLLDVKSHLARKTYDNTGLPYYLGSLILHQEGGKLYIIDSQQRIPTAARMACLSGQG